MFCKFAPNQLKMKRITILLVSTFLLFSCDMIKKQASNINMFTVDQDRELGTQVAAEIDGNPTEYPIVDSAANSQLYAYVYKIRNKILNSGKLQHKDDFSWRVRIVDNDEVLNAFCTPGGYIYVYTGIMKYLDSEDQLAGVLGHEIAHADMRHSTRQMTTMYGVDALMGALAGDKAILKTIATGISSLSGLKFSRTHETEADNKSVEFLCPTDYNADGGGKFFEKMIADGQGKTIEFLSTHPNPDKRVENFHAQKQALECKGTKDYKSEYATMKSKYLNNIVKGGAPVINMSGVGTIKKP